MTLNYNDTNRPSDTSRLPGPLVQAYNNLNSPEHAMSDALTKICAETAQIMVSVVKTLHLREAQHATARCLTGPRNLDNFLTNGDRTSVKLPFGSVVIEMSFTNPGLLRLEYQLVESKPTAPNVEPEASSFDLKDIYEPARRAQQSSSPVTLADLVYGTGERPTSRREGGLMYAQDYIAAALHTQALAWSLEPLLTDFAGSNNLRLYTGYISRETLEYIFIDGER